MYNHILKGLIENTGLTQQEFAKRLGISNGTLSNLITNERSAHPRHRQTIAEYFGKPEAAIFNAKFIFSRKKREAANGYRDQNR